jgi:charged multivesicular body protein 4A/B
MFSWFGGSASSQARKDAPKKAILGLRQQLEMLQKREKHLESQIQEQDNIARKNVSSNKAGMFALERMDNTAGRPMVLEQERII